MQIADKEVGKDYPAYFIADIAANHDGSLQKAIDLMGYAKESGADAAKFQHFRAEFIVSDKGFRELGDQISHQAKWDKSVFEVYKEASLPWEWTEKLAKEAERIGIHFFTSPYDIQAVDHVDKYVSAFKIGSGDITWHEIIKYISKKDKPTILATGAANQKEVDSAVAILEAEEKQYCLMQCNTNYTGDAKNFKYINLRVLETYKRLYPKAILGLSDHTAGDTTVLGAISLGAKMIEKHFTLDNNSEGPDHSFSMTPISWHKMVERTREMEDALGKELKEVEENEQETVILQRRGLRFSCDLKENDIIMEKDLVSLRPANKGCLEPYRVKEVLGKRLKRDVGKHDIVNLDDLK